MTEYRRNFVKGGSYFFTVALADRRQGLLVDHIGVLRAAFRDAKIALPFNLDAIVILPEHLHCIWTLPEDDADYPERWRRIKATFSRGLPNCHPRSPSKRLKGERGIWQRRYWEHTLRDEKDRQRHMDYIHYNPVKHRYVERVPIGLIPRFIVMLMPEYISEIGVGAMRKAMAGLVNMSKEMMGCASLHPSYFRRHLMKSVTLAATLTAMVLFFSSHTLHAETHASLEVGQPAPDFKLPDQNGKMRTLADFRGKWLALYFYVKDDTPGCTEQACKFRDDIHELSDLGAQVVGVSVDNTVSHANFAKKYNLPFPLLADSKGETAARYDSLRADGSLAKRNTFLIDPEGRIAKIYLSASTSRNSADVIADLKRLRGS